MRSISSICFAVALVACGSNKGNGDDTDSGNGGVDACVGLECQVVNCAAMGQQPTTLTGTVYAPNGTLPLYGITVYVPLSDPGPVPDGLECDRCSNTLPGGAVAQATSGEDGTFRLENVPVGDNIPLVIKSGKWRRQITIPRVDQCVDTPLAATETSLPKTKAEGNIPKIALTTGSADSLECLVRKLGLEAEMSGSSGNGRIHLYTGNGISSDANGTFANATTLWSSETTLKNYDIVILSCEGSQRPATKPQPTLDAMKAYADAGGRVFASHWHNIWIGGNFTADPDLAPAVWKDLIEWNAGDGNPGDPVLIDEVSNPKGSAFANWMVNVGGSGPMTSPTPTMRGEITLQAAGRRMTARGIVDPTRVERWVHANNQIMAPQNFQFTTPNEIAQDQRCGKVVFSDMHVSADSNPTNPFPAGCSNQPLTPQEKALAFMFFDIASCVGSIL